MTADNAAETKDSIATIIWLAVPATLPPDAKVPRLRLIENCRSLVCMRSYPASSDNTSVLELIHRTHTKIFFSEHLDHESGLLD